MEKISKTTLRSVRNLSQRLLSLVGGGHPVHCRKASRTGASVTNENKKFSKQTDERHETHTATLCIPLFIFILRKVIKKSREFRKHTKGTKHTKSEFPEVLDLRSDTSLTEFMKPLKYLSSSFVDQAWRSLLDNSLFVNRPFRPWLTYTTEIRLHILLTCLHRGFVLK